jgi:signal peptidase I
MGTTKRGAFRGVGFGLVVAFVFALFLKLDFRSVIVDGHSMLPSLTPGERVIVSNAYWLVGAIHDGDIVVVRDPGSSGFIIKRVFKMGGEKVPVDKWPDSRHLEDGEYSVPEGDIYVLGDNLQQSEDSRRFGPVPLNKVIGKVVIRP